MDESKTELVQITKKNPGQEKASSTRRFLLFGLGGVLNLFAGVALTIPIVGYILSSAIQRKDWRGWITLGPLSNYPPGKTRMATYRNPFSHPWDGKTADIPCWVRRTSGNDFKVFAINCAHLGCPVRWFEESGLFLCPCHGGAYYEDGSRAAGPPPRGLFEYEYKIQSGQLWVKAGEIPTLSNPVS